ncbi:hypothetical protein [Paraburkholderia sp. BL10I2N1]|uniref:hypothetical protein n=1 Tax=Paraburkholderia sp. BL10I2N1 TaxID=1938796 RepID=UPI00105CD474|nr:hypothetical protein [Paraburkholderia sp. BL10I2N1]TDN70449.1 hypothetical protein B0G77_3923 [Paraburkholderia sp. BL10I2N1]
MSSPKRRIAQVFPAELDDLPDLNWIGLFENRVLVLVSKDGPVAVTRGGACDDTLVTAEYAVPLTLRFEDDIIKTVPPDELAEAINERSREAMLEYLSSRFD